jgi:hypothetical protein
VSAAREPLAPTLRRELVDAFSERLRLAPLAQAELAEARAILEGHQAPTAALEGPPLPAAALEALWRAIDAAEALLLEDPGVAAIFPRVTLRRLLLELVAGVPLPGGAPMQILAHPRLPGRPVWAIRDEADADALRRRAAPGSVWIRVDHLRARDWAVVRALATESSRLLGGTRGVGRRPGSTTPARRQLIARLVREPDLSIDDVATLAAALGAWPADLASDRRAVAKRVGRLRQAAQRIRDRRGTDQRLNH